MSHRDIALIQSSIVNGRIYFSTSDVKFFPSDSYGDRERDGHRGNPVRFRAGDLALETDIRLSSSTRLSPRSSFAGFFKKVGAVEGGTLRITRTADREYQVDYLGQGEGTGAEKSAH